MTYRTETLATVALVAFLGGLVVAAEVDAASPMARVNHVRPIAAAAFPAADARCGHVNIVRVPSLPTGANASPKECLVRVDDALIRKPRGYVCATLVHEFGHIDLTTGRGPHDPRDARDHSRNPRSIMFGDHLAVDAVPACNRLTVAEHDLAATLARAAALRELRADTRSRPRRRRLNRRIGKLKRRAAALRYVVGP